MNRLRPDLRDGLFDISFVCAVEYIPSKARRKYPVEQQYVVVDNVQREPRSGRILRVSFWVCGPTGQLSGPFDENAAQREAYRLNTIATELSISQDGTAGNT